MSRIYANGVRGQHSSQQQYGGQQGQQTQQSPPPQLTPEAEIAELKQQLLHERQRNQYLTTEVARLRQAAVEINQAAEAEEESIINRMVKRLEEIKKEKEDLALEVEREEELLTNTLQRKLTQVRAEKESVEAQLEGELRSLAEVREQLERKVSELQAEKESFEAYVEHDLDGLLARLQEGLNRLTAGEGHADSQEEIHLLRSIMKQICGLRERVARQSRSHSFA